MSARIAVFSHMFYADLFPEVAHYLANIPFPVDLYLSTSKVEDRDYLRQIFPDATIEIVPNRGRDIAPKFITFAQAHTDYDCVLHLHTKASNPAWRRHLLDHLIGSPETTTAILDAFERNERIGVVAPSHYSAVAPWVHWTDTRHYAEPLAERMGIVLPDTIEFPAGSMFWARPSALRPLQDLGLRYEDFPPEPSPERSTIAHAIERMIFISAVHAGHGWCLSSLNGGRLQIEGPYFSPARPSWQPPPKPTKEGNALVRLVRRLRRSAGKRFGGVRQRSQPPAETDRQPAHP